MESHDPIPTLTFADLDDLRRRVRTVGAPHCTWAEPDGAIGSLIHTYPGYDVRTGEPMPSNLYGGRAFVTEQLYTDRLRYTVRIVTYRPGWPRCYTQAVIGCPAVYTDPLGAHLAAARVGDLHRDGFIPAYLEPGDANRIAERCGIPPFVYIPEA